MAETLLDPLTRETVLQSGQEPQPQARPRRPVWFFVCCTIYALTLAVISLGNLLGPERWWWSSFNLYLPQWGWGLPALPLLFYSLRYARRAVWLPILFLVWVVVPIMGFCFNVGFGAKGTPLRVMTYNVKRGGSSHAAILDDIERNKPDILLLQEYTSQMDEAFDRRFPDWNKQRVSQFLVATRFPLSEVETRSINSDYFVGDCMRCRVDVGPALITLFNVHFISPRGGLMTLRTKKADGIEGWEWNFLARLEQAKILAEQLEFESGPLLVAGDMNAPQQSLVIRELMEKGLHDAYAEGGRGFGYTYGHNLKARHSFIRIDHILINDRWRTRNCWVGSAEGADHRPVIADLVLLDK